MNEKTIQNEVKPKQKEFANNLTSEDLESLKDGAASDSLTLYGEDQLGNSLYAKIVILPTHNEVSLVLRLKDGRIFTLPEHPDTKVKKRFSFLGGGLSFECLIPMRSWRIRFNGLLREGVRSQWSPDAQDSQLVPVKFNFFWAVKSKPLFWPADWSASLTAESFKGASQKAIEYFSRPDSCYGYDQYGAMLGEVFIGGRGGDTEQFEINLPGSRQRRWAVNEGIDLQVTSSITGVLANGMVFNLGTFSAKGIKGVFGTANLAGGKAEVVEWSKADEKSSKISFKVKDQVFEASLEKQEIFNLLGSEVSPWAANFYSLSLTLDGGLSGKGIAMFSAPYNQSASIPAPELYLEKGYCFATPTPSKYIYPFADPETSSVQISGGKGASLALLTEISHMKYVLKANMEATSIAIPSFGVPQGAVLSVSAMEAMVSQTHSLNSKIDQLVQLCAEGSEFKEQCQEIQKEIEALSLTEAIRKDIQTVVQKMIDENARIAVRSSSVCEDGEDVSAAGQNDTFLGLRTVEDVLVSVKRCWGSLYSYQSVHYRKQNIQPIRTGMAVVLQTMLDSECAGVLFSNHPITGDSKQCLVSANYGLGESVVSGEVDPDNYVVQRSYKDDKFTLVEKVAGKKGYRIQMNADNSIEKVAVDGDEFCLSDEIVLKLAEIATRLEVVYGNARDIEWGIKNGQIYLLQSRPITALNQFSDWEIINEVNSSIMSEMDVSTTTTVQEVMPGAFGALSRHYVLTSMDGATEIIEWMHKDPYGGLIQVARHHVFADLYKMFFQGADPQITIAMRMNGIIFAGYDFLTDELCKTAQERAPDASEMPTKWQLTKAIISQCWTAKARADEAMAMAKNFRGTYSKVNLAKFKSPRELFEDIEKNIRILSEIMKKHGSTSMAHSVYNRTIMSMLTNGKDTVTDSLMEDYKLVSSSAKDTISAEIPKALERMAKGIFATGKKAEFCQLEAENGIQWLEKNCPKTHKFFHEFLDKNEHRGHREYDFMSATWGIRPALLIEQLQAILKFAETEESLGKTNECAELSPSQVVKKLKNANSWTTRLILPKVITWSENAVQYREKTKYSYISALHQFRCAFWHLGRMMQQEGFLSSWDLIFCLSGPEVNHLLDTRDVQLVKKAARRQKIIQQLRKDRYDDVMMGVPRPKNAQKKALNFEAGTEIRGTSVYGGVITGRASVLNDFSEVGKIQPGDILITYSTDIGWSPYFPILGGVVTEIGGLISHGAVVAREYGLPCVVAAANAVEFFTDGEIVTLDAARGVIFKGTGN